MDYLYDGSFEGLLTAIYYNYYREHATGIYPTDNYQIHLVNPSSIVETDPQLAAKVYDAAYKKISSSSLQRVFHAYLSNHPLKENLILNYLRLGFKLGAKIDRYYTHPDVCPIQEIARKVSFETHRFLGLLRFAEAQNCLYALFEPDHNILILVADHFADRLANENFVIHDTKRDLAVIYSQKSKTWYLTDFPRDLDISISKSEIYYQTLWTNYFTHIGIESRKNNKLQTQFIPLRYRRNLVEFQNHPQ